ncbi:MAG: class I SAM-dependent methyltransferase [Alphaproteobacteria bacterium]|nr:class I SAM-dependent methyltransferase [Alphaproteobacteria bacterium]MBU0796107.1 class I SAM-dependent methyltransferase [Alphaproteobacteria bacterium]MBU0888478.1 class I SAM-dependent methyltransferase [Alphaproteobacteria bacterium]MBU1813059.1 class I SAM-dependent methyltransferase [Alphaproteobacteria bacterium]MBU2089404.1 class I SAM-dependent methyltransferase [Alphaproteobacteria bacterium]
MYDDIVDLRDFYASRLGQMARRMVRRKLRTLWPDIRGQSLLGIGYTTPYLRPFMDEASRVVALMPAGQGVMHWPREGPNVTVLSEESDIPLPDASMDRVLMVHGLEGSEQLRPMLAEIWRVMAGNGRLLVVVPHRRSLWTMRDSTPFGHGQPYSGTQISRLLRDAQFTPVERAGALYAPPLRSRLLLRSAMTLETLGERWFPQMSGVVLIEATKQVYAMTGRREPKRRRLLIPMPQPATQGAPAGARPAFREEG